jgi:hypothetical protein
VLHSQFPADVYLEGTITRSYTLLRDHQGPRAVLNALERLVTGYASESVRVREALSIAASQLRDYHARLGKPFVHDAYLAELTGLRDQLNAGLSASNHQPDKEEGPTASELADKIKALKAAKSIEATPQRVRQKQSTAEEPITSRIRRRAESMSEPESAKGADVIPQPEPPSPSVGDQTMNFQERILRERQIKNEGLDPT